MKDNNLKHFPQNCSQVNAKICDWLGVNTGSDNGLVSSENKPLPESMLTQLCPHIMPLGPNQLNSQQRIHQSASWHRAVLYYLCIGQKAGNSSSNTVKPLILAKSLVELNLNWRLLITQLSELLQLHFHFRHDTWLQWIGQRQLHDEMRNF